MAHRSHRPAPSPAGRILATTALLLGGAVLAAVVYLWPGEVRSGALREVGVVREVYEARVTASVMAPCAGTAEDSGIRCRRVHLALLEGPDAGEEAVLEFPATGASPALATGDRVVLAHHPGAPTGLEYSFVDRQRKPVLFWLAALFAAAVVLLGRLRGLAALAGLAITFVVLLQFVLPAILNGQSPLVVSLVGGSAIAFLALYVAHGLNAMTTVALLGTLGSLGLTAVLATAFVGLAELSGFASDEAALVTIGAGQIDLRGLILGGVVIGALGALDDVTVTQASAVWELRAANPSMKVSKLYRSGLRIGRAHIASTVNTLVLAYAGASMPVLLLFVLSEQSLATVANGEVVATEIVRTLVGSIGLVASVPLTTWLAARTAPFPPEEEPSNGPAAPARPRERRRASRRADMWLEDW